MGDRRTCCSFLPAASVTVRGLHGACNHRCHCRSGLRVGFPSMKRDSFAGAFHGLGKRGRGVCTINADCAGEELEGLAQNLASSKFCDIGRRRTLARDRASGVAARMGSALLHREHSTSPTTEQLARDVPERSEDEARPVTGAAHAGSSSRDSFAGAVGAGRMTARSAGGRPAGVVVPPREARGSVPPMLGRLHRPGFQRLEEPTGPASNPWKPGPIPCTAGQDRR